MHGQLDLLENRKANGPQQSSYPSYMHEARTPSNLLWRFKVTGMLSFRVNIEFADLLGGKTLEEHTQMALYPVSKISHMSKCNFHTVIIIRHLRRLRCAAKSSLRKEEKSDLYHFPIAFLTRYYLNAKQQASISQHLHTSPCLPP